MAITKILRWVIFLSAASCVWAADARNGALVLEQQGCQRCHPVRGLGLEHETPQVTPDLGGRLAPTYGPHTLASALWNHTPAMWAEFTANGVPPPNATESDWQDLFAYLYSLQFFEPPGEIGRGKQVQAVHRLPFSVERSERARPLRSELGSYGRPRGAGLSALESRVVHEKHLQAQ